MTQQTSTNNNQENHQETHRAIPSSWELWALINKCIANGHLDSLLQSVDTAPEDYLEFAIVDTTFDRAIKSLYIETCESIPPINADDLKEKDILIADLDKLANSIVINHKQAKSILPSIKGSAHYFDKVCRNCKLILELLKVADDPNSLKIAYSIVDGKCFRHVDFKTFSEALSNQSGKEANKLIPIPGMGMALYVFLLFIKPETTSVPTSWEVIDGVLYEVLDYEKWRKALRRSIKWGDRYFLDEEEWKDAYLATNPVVIKHKSLPSHKKKLRELCSGRAVFEDIISKRELNQLSEGQIICEPGYTQYKYIRDHKKSLSVIRLALISELEFFYQNIECLSGNFVDKCQAEHLIMTSDVRNQLRMTNDSEIHSLYSGKSSTDDYLINRLLCQRVGYAYCHLREQPVVYSEMVAEFIEKCIVQDERLLQAVSRFIADIRIQVSAAKTVKAGISNPMEEILSELINAKYIDEEGNILPLKEGGRNTQFSELTRELVRKEFVKPEGDWPKAIQKVIRESISGSYSEQSSDGKRILKSESLDDDEKFQAIVALFVREIDWKKFDGKFILNGKRLSDKDLRQRFNDIAESRKMIIKRIISKYHGVGKARNM